jgi:transcriptional regulator with XRE-family HTH domain
MEAKKMSQTKLAQKSGVDNSIISRLVSGKRTRPSYLTVQKLAKALRVSIKRLEF